MPPRISLILPTYNMACFLPEAISSVMGQTLSDFELIIMDDGSTDKTPEVVERFGAKSECSLHYYRVSHQYKAAAINVVLKEHPPRGDFIAFMDADDLLPPDSLEKRYKAITEKKTDMAAGAFAITNLKGERLETRKLPPDIDKGKLLNHFFYGTRSPLHLNGMLVSKSLVKKTGFFDEHLTRGQEMDYAIRLLKNADDYTIIPEVVYHYQKYHRALGERIRMRLQTIRCRRRWLGKHLNGMKQAGAITEQATLDFLKLLYEIIRNY